MNNVGTETVAVLYKLMILRLRISLADAASWISFSCVDDLGDLIDFWDLNEKMEVEKRSSKGGFLQLFDYIVNSWRKLFSAKSELFGNFLFDIFFSFALLSLCLILSFFIVYFVLLLFFCRCTV